MTWSTPPAWKWRDECDVPVTTDDLSIHSRKLPDSDALCERNGSGTEPEMSSSTTRKLCPDCGCGPSVQHNAKCGCTAQVADSAINAVPEHPAWVCTDCGQDRYGDRPLLATWHWDRCDICGKYKAVTEARDFGNLYDDEPIYKVTAPETTSPADSCVEHRHRNNFYGGYLLAGVTDPPKCPVCLHEMENDEGVLCESCGEPTGPGSFAVVNGPGGVFVFHLRCYDEVYWGEDMDTDVDEGLISGDGESVPCGQRVGEDGICGYWSGGQEIPERETCSEEETPLWHPDEVADSFDVPFSVQSWTFEALIELEIDHLHEIIDDHHDEIVKMARRRHRTGHVLHGSKGYSWDPETRLRNVLEELSDGGTYLTMGPIK